LIFPFSSFSTGIFCCGCGIKFCFTPLLLLLIKNPPLNKMVQFYTGGLGKGMSRKANFYVKTINQGTARKHRLMGAIERRPASEAYQDKTFHFHGTEWLLWQL
jgi:hypothetical protein